MYFNKFKKLKLEHKISYLILYTVNHQQKSIKLNEYKDEYILINFKKLKLDDKIS